MNNKDFITATQCVLYYAGNTQEEVDIYTSVLTHLSGRFEISKAKSIRYENDFRLLNSVRTARSLDVTITCPYAKGELEVTVIEYYVHTEDIPRYAFFSKAFPKAFSVRYFKDKSKFNKFQGNAWVNALSTLSFWNSCILKYATKDSKVERYAIHFTDENRNINEFLKDVTILPKAESNTNAESTGFFGE